MQILTPEESPLFTKWIDPASGIESLILTERVAPLQKSFYYTNTSFSADGRFMWIDCAFPPGTMCQLALADLATGKMTLCPETQHEGYPYVEQDTGYVYWGMGLNIWKRGPKKNDRPELVNTFPEELARNRKPKHLSSHFTLSADGKSFAIDAAFSNEWIIGDMPLDGSPFKLWHSFDRCYDHVQFSPTDPDMILLMQDGWVNTATGKSHDSTDRLWLIRRGGKAYQILPNNPLPSGNRGHEWWDADGKHVWFIDYTEGPDQGTKKVCLETEKVEAVWPHGHSHSHCDRNGRYLAGDIVSWPKDEWEVAFFNRDTGNEVSIVTTLPPCELRSAYHIHPHPQFCLQDRYVCYTTNVRGQVDFALTSVKHLLDMTK